MSDLFSEKALEWDKNEMVRQLSTGVGSAILANIDLKPEMQVLDFGAGTGLVSSFVAPHVAKISAVDISEAMLEKLAAKPELAGKVETICQDILQTPLEERFDLIISAMAMHHVKHTDELLNALASHLKPGGQVALADLDKEEGDFHDPGTEGVYHSGFDRDVLREMFESAGFVDVQFITAVTVTKGEKSYPVFLLTAKKV